jgi:hypothetical protein
MPTVHNTVKAPDGTPLAARIVITLVAASIDDEAAAFTPDDWELLGRWTTRADPDTGEWEVELPANAALNPAGTVYKVTETVRTGTSVRYFELPDTDETYDLEDVETSAPTAVDLATYVLNTLGGRRRLVTANADGTYEIDPAAGTVWRLTITGDVEISVAADVIPAGFAAELEVWIVHGGFAVTWEPATILPAGGWPIVTDTTAGKIDRYSLASSDDTDTWALTLLGADYREAS